MNNKIIYYCIVCQDFKCEEPEHDLAIVGWHGGVEAETFFGKAGE